MKDNKSVLKECMTEKQRKSLGNRPTWHSVCIACCGVARPGKTKRDRLKREQLRD